MAHEWSPQQTAIFHWFEKSFVPDHFGGFKKSQNLVGRARAGTGKSTVIEEGVKRAPERAILVAAFSKAIQLAFEARLKVNGVRQFPHIKVQTLHSVGLACVRRFRDRIDVSFNSDRADQLTAAVCGSTVPDARAHPGASSRFSVPARARADRRLRRRPVRKR